MLVRSFPPLFWSVLEFHWFNRRCRARPWPAGSAVWRRTRRDGFEVNSSIPESQSEGNIQPKSRLMLLLPQRVRARCSNHRELVQDTWKSEMLRNVWFWILQIMSAGGNNCVFVGFAGGIFRTPTVGQNYVVIKKYIVWRYVMNFFVMRMWGIYD